MRVALIFAVTLLASCGADAIAAPRASWRRAPLALALHALALLFLFSLFMFLTARPLFSAFCSVALLVLMGVVSNAKYTTLREPFVFSDLSLFAQLFKHPRLYLPFLSTRTFAAAGAAVLLLALGFWAERPVLPHPWILSLFIAAACLALGYGAAARLPLTLDAFGYQRRHGFFAVFVAYLLNGLRPATARGLREALGNSPFAVEREGEGAADAFGYEAAEPARRAVPPTVSPASPADALLADDARPDVIVIQSESYFDARALGRGINSSVYAQFDRACRESVSYGKLTVPAWGANTMRSEFSMLTGVPSDALGYARFYPYAFLRRACASLPGWFKRRGYRTLALHPYYADFFGRNRVFPLLQFDRFLDIVHFDHAPRAGPYVGDAAVADAILEALDEAPRGVPRFVFSMTMENHGPLHLESVHPGEAAVRHALGVGDEWRELTIYLRHVANADAMLGRLLTRLRARRRPTVVCFYGDHVPALPRVFSALGEMPERSDYLIWRNFGARPAVRHDVSIESLGTMLLDATRMVGPGVTAANQATSEKTTHR